MHTYDGSADDSRRSGCNGLSVPVRLDDGDLLDVLWQLDASIESGVPLSRALQHTVYHLEGSAKRALVERLARHMACGIPLSIALDRSLCGCSRLVYAVVSIGETTGRLDLAISLLRRMYRLQEDWRSSFTSWAVTSPRLFVSFWSALFLIAWHGAQTHPELWDDPPNATTMPFALECIGGLLYEPLFYPLVVLLVIWYAIWRNRGGVGFVRLAREAILRLPWVGGMLRNRLAARCLRLLAFILETGKPPLASVSVIAEFADRSDVRRVFRSSGEVLRNGGPLSQAFAVSGLLPERAVATIASAEDLGTLPETVAWLAETYEAQVGFESVTAGSLFAGGIEVIQIGLLISAINMGFSPLLLLSGL